jgi:hypothetical protein
MSRTAPGKHRFDYKVHCDRFEGQGRQHPGRPSAQLASQDTLAHSQAGPQNAVIPEKRCQVHHTIPPRDTPSSSG